MTQPRPILWTPDKARVNGTTMAGFIRFLSQSRQLQFDDYNALWHWSITDLEGFWSAIVEFFDLETDMPGDVILQYRQMPGARWFPGSRVNFAAQMPGKAGKTKDVPALVIRSETFGHTELTWADLAAQVASVAHHFRAMGVGPGDRVAAVLPNTEVAVIAFLASASLGAIWSLCAPDMGHVAILDRFRQIEPDLTGHRTVPAFEQVDFDHPLWVVYSSGTTGTPKPIVQGHGGIFLEGAKQSLHQDLGPREMPSSPMRRNATGRSRRRNRRKSHETDPSSHQLIDGRY